MRPFTKPVITSLISFFVTFSVYAGLQWVPYNPQRDYDGNVLVVGDEGRRGQTGGGICRAVDENEVIRVGTINAGICNYGTNLHPWNDVIDHRQRTLYYYVSGAIDKFDVLVAPSHKDYSWFFNINLVHLDGDHRFSDSTTVFNANDGNNSFPDVHICRHIKTTDGWSGTSVRYVGQYIERKGVPREKGCYYYSAYSDAYRAIDDRLAGRKGVVHQILVQH